MQIVLQKPHEHAGTLRMPGEVIELADDIAHWLCEIGSAQPADSAVKPGKQSNTTQE